MNLNYSALHEPVSDADIKAYEAAHPPKKISKLLKVFVAILYIFLLWMALSGLLIGEHGVLIIVLVMLGPTAWIYYKYIYGRKKKLARLHKFALQNQLKLMVDAYPRDYAGVTFSAGHSHVINEAFIFPDGSEIGSHKFTTGSGKNQRVHYWGYMRVKLVRNVPNMLLDSKKNNFLGGRFSNLPLAYKKEQTIELEGNFNDYFTLYAPVDYGKDAFYIFTPDVMAALIDHGSDFDIEVVDNYLMFYRTMPINLESEQEIRELRAVLDRVSTELIDQADYYADERVGNRELDTVAEPGRRLKQRVPVAVIIIVAIYVLYFVVSPVISFLTHLLTAR